MATEEDHDDGNEDDGKIALSLLLAGRVDPKTGSLIKILTFIMFRPEFHISGCYIYPRVKAE